MPFSLFHVFNASISINCMVITGHIVAFPSLFTAPRGKSLHADKNEGLWKSESCRWPDFIYRCAISQGMLL
jgi:hypothetical protein